MTGRRVSFVDLDLPLRLRSPAGPVALTSRELTIVREAGAASECRLLLELEPEAWRTVDRDRLFHLDPEARGPGAGRFHPTGPVRIEARLASELLPQLLAGPAEPREAAALLAEVSSAGAESPLLWTESWFALSVTSPVEVPEDLAAEGSLAEGYATSWASDDRRLRLPMLAVVEQVLEDRGWRYEELDDDTGFRWRMAGPDGVWACYALAREADERFAVYSVLDVAIPPELMRDGAELVTRANHGLLAGNWELDMDEGTLRFKTTVDVTGDRLSVALAANLVERNLTVVDAYLAAFAAFAEGRLSAEEAIARAEG